MTIQTVAIFQIEGAEFIMRKFVVFILILFSLHDALAAENELVVGKVEQVVSGNILLLRSGEDEIYVRLAGIDTPDPKQPYGKEAITQLNNLVKNKVLLLRLIGYDQCNRNLAIAWLRGDNGLDLSSRMVANGAAWVFQINNPELLELEKQAKQKRIGLWALSHDKRLPPWEWRKHARLEGHQPILDCRKVASKDKENSYDYYY